MSYKSETWLISLITKDAISFVGKSNLNPEDKRVLLAFISGWGVGSVGKILLAEDVFVLFSKLSVSTKTSARVMNKIVQELTDKYNLPTEETKDW